MYAEVYSSQSLPWLCLTMLALLDANDAPVVGVHGDRVAIKLDLSDCDSVEVITQAVQETFAMYGNGAECEVAIYGSGVVPRVTR